MAFGDDTSNNTQAKRKGKKNQIKWMSKLTKVGPMYLVQWQPFGNGDGYVLCTTI
jgi:hypothetical protein